MCIQVCLVRKCTRVKCRTNELLIYGSYNIEKYNKKTAACGKSAESNIGCQTTIETIEYGTSDHDPPILKIGREQAQIYHHKQRTNWRRLQNLTQEIKVPTINNVLELNQCAKNL